MTYHIPAGSLIYRCTHVYHRQGGGWLPSDPAKWLAVSTTKPVVYDETDLFAVCFEFDRMEWSEYSHSEVLRKCVTEFVQLAQATVFGAHRLFFFRLPNDADPFMLIVATADDVEERP